MYTQNDTSEIHSQVIDKGYYSILGIECNATAAEIRSAYKKLALRYHPDKNPENKKEAELMFKNLAEAYTVLGDVDKRIRYDQNVKKWSPSQCEDYRNYKYHNFQNSHCTSASVNCNSNFYYHCQR